MNVRIEREINHTRLVSSDTGKEIVSEIFSWIIEKMEKTMAQEQEE